MAMPPPDFARVQIETGQKQRPVGDPTLWANSITTLIDDDPVLGSTPRVVEGSQIILAQAADRYARNWSIVGNLTLSFAGWTGPAAPITAPEAPDFETDDPMSVWLEVVQGIEKVTISQLILIKAGGSPSTQYGLANDQWSASGGPYGAQYNNTRAYTPGITTESTRSFATIGAWIGNTVSVRALYVRGGVLGQPRTIAMGRMSLLLSPYAPGAGI